MCFITFCLCFMSNSTCSLLVYRDTIDYILTFYPTICNNCLLVPGGLVFLFFFLQSFRIFYIDNHVLYEQRVLFLPSNVYIFYIFSVLIALVSNSSTILKRSGERRHSRFVPYLSRKMTKKYNVSCRFL